MYYDHLRTLLAKSTNDEQLFEAIANAPFHDKLQTTNLDLGMIVFVLVNKAEQTIDRISYSHTSPAHDAIKASPKTFQEIKLPLNNKVNVTCRAIQTDEPQMTSDWRYLFTPVISADAARLNQAEAGMGCSFIYPLINARDGGALIFSFYQTLDMIGPEHHEFMKTYTKLASGHLQHS